MANKEKKQLPNPSMIEIITNYDLIEELHDLLGKKMVIPPESGKLEEIEPLRTIGYDDPWIYTNPDMHRDCHLYTLQVEKLDYIPPRCMECWKVVARPQTLKETFQMLHMQELMIKKDKTCWCKIGAEYRPWVHANWGAYFYNNSFEKGREKWKWVREMVDEHVSPEVNVILKRGCTEFERKYGPSIGWDAKFKDNPKCKAWDGIVKDNMVRQVTSYFQPDIIKKHVMAKWVAFAYDREDPTVIELNDGRPMLPPLVFYHNELEKEYKINKMKKQVKETRDNDKTDN